MADAALRTSESNLIAGCDSDRISVTLRPPIARWTPADHTPDAVDEVRRLVDENARRLGTPALSDRRRIIATGHQAWLWHPGILAKDLAACALAEREDAAALHLVVDHDVQDPLSLTAPFASSDGGPVRLRRETIDLAAQPAGVPAGMQPPADAEAVVARLQQLDRTAAVDLSPLVAAWRNLPAVRTLGEQVSVVLHRLRGTVDASLPVLFGTQLQQLSVFRSFVQRMVGDARACIRAYNRASQRHPAAGIGLLQTQADRVELPLWLLRSNGPRQRVYADLADTQPRLVDETGQPVAIGRRDAGDDRRLAPRALSLTAFMRRFACNLFIHGTGGGEYDRVTEQWIAAWTGEPLAPMAVATADLHLDFNAPLADRATYNRAVWRRHHLPHNIDRALADGDALDADLGRRKREILQAMQTITDRDRKAALFDELHAINDELTSRHPELIEDAEAMLREAGVGLENAKVAARRDWCFAFYPDHCLQTLKGEIRRRASTPPI